MDTQPIPASYARLVIREFDASIPTHALLENTGLTEDSIRWIDSITLHQLLTILRNIAIITANPAIGLQLGSLLQPATHGSVGWAAITSPTLAKALAVLCRYSVLQVPFFRFETSATEHRSSIRITPLQDLADQHAVLTECALLLLQQVIHCVAGHTPADSKITLDYPPPVYAERYTQTFNCPVVFSQSAIEFSFPRTCQDLTSTTADTDMCEIALDQCRNAERRLRAGGELDATVRDLLEKHLEDHLTVAQVAYRLAISPRTLIRRLKKRSTSFQTISDRLYADKAADYMQRTDISVNSVAQLLGYKDSANFRRSFKRWFHMTPIAYRTKTRSAKGTNPTD